MSRIWSCSVQGVVSGLQCSHVAFTYAYLCSSSLDLPSHNNKTAFPAPMQPITFILPPLMWIKARSPAGAELALNLCIAGSCSVIALLSLIGSARNIVVLASEFSIFD